MQTTLEYLSDIAHGRIDPFVFKTAEFVKRNFNSIKHTLQHLLYEVRKIKSGFKKLWKDTKFLMGTKKSMYTQKYEKVDVMAKHKSSQVQTDVMKFIPFSVFILVPGLELLLPPFLVIFPNSVPSQFMSDDARAAKIEKFKERRAKAATLLTKKIPNYLFYLENDELVEKEDKLKLQELKAALKNPHLLPTDLLQYRGVFKRYADFRHLGVEQLRQMAYFMSLEPVTGVNILNNLLRIFKTEIPITTPGVSLVSKQLMVRELNMYFARLRSQDENINFDMLQNFSEREINKLCFMRGIDVDNQNLSKRVKDLKLWLSISNQRNVNNTLLLFCRLNDFKSEMFEISEDEDEQEVLRRSNMNTYYLEKMRVFEETFGIDKLLTQVDKLQ